MLTSQVPSLDGEGQKLTMGSGLELLECIGTHMKHELDNGTFIFTDIPPLENRQALVNWKRSGRILQGDNP